MDHFRLKYRVDYNGETLSTAIEREEIEDDMDDHDIARLIAETIEEDAKQRVFPYCTNEEELMEWVAMIRTEREKI